MKWYHSLLLLTLIVACTGPQRQSQAEKCIYYSEYGAVGDGVTDDFDAIIRAHEAANKAGLPVCADAGATYYIGGAGKTAEIQTNTDWGNARFIIDDINVENRSSSIFIISSKLSPEQITAVTIIKKDQDKLDLSLRYRSFIVVTDSTTMRYIREGLNQDNGSPQTDMFVIDENGNVDMKAPIMWDFNNISSMTAYPIDTQILTISGGHFTTIANQAESKYTYYARNISIQRSNVVIEKIYHAVTGESYYGAPYTGFIAASNCTDVTVQNSMLSGHMTYMTIGSAGLPVEMGSYDISIGRSTNVTFRNCRQINDIHDTKLWGIMGSNYSKNLTLDSVEFSRFDAHKGVANATIKNSVLGWKGIEITGKGILLIENTKVCGPSIVNLRDDYGSTWEGEIIIRNCEYKPRNGAVSDAFLISGSYSGQHNFGYTCYLPEKITIDGLIIDDSNPVKGYEGPKIFAAFNSRNTSEAYKEKYPYVMTREVVIENITIRSGKPYIVSANPYMFRNVKITQK